MRKHEQLKQALWGNLSRTSQNNRPVLDFNHCWRRGNKEDRYWDKYASLWPRGIAPWRTNYLWAFFPHQNVEPENKTWKWRDMSVFKIAEWSILNNLIYRLQASSHMGPDRNPFSLFRTTPSLSVQMGYRTTDLVEGMNIVELIVDVDSITQSCAFGMFLYVPYLKYFLLSAGAIAEK